MDEAGNKPIGFPSLLLMHGEPRDCPYLEGRQAEEEFTLASRLDGSVHQALMDMGFRRSGEVVYRPVCRDCSECVPIRVPVPHFKSSRSQRRVLRRNADVRVETGPPECTEEKWRVYAEYLAYQHDGTMDAGFRAFEQFLYRSPTETLEMRYYVGDRFVAVGIVDVCPDCLSSVYLYFDPAEARRSLGVFGALCEIEECRRRGLAYWYLGFYVAGCRRMSYKAQYRPYELLAADGVWRPGDAPV